MLEQEKMLNEAVPEAIVELVRCKCKKGCKNNFCCCRKANLVCTDACFCHEKEDCENEYNDASISDDDDDF